MTDASEHALTCMYTLRHIWTRLNISKHSSTCLNTRQHVWTRFNMSEHASTYRNTLQHVWTRLNMSDHALTCLNTLQHVWTRLNMSEICYRIATVASDLPSSRALPRINISATCHCHVDYTLSSCHSTATLYRSVLPLCCHTIMVGVATLQALYTGRC